MKISLANVLQLTTEIALALLLIRLASIIFAEIMTRIFSRVSPTIAVAGDGAAYVACFITIRAVGKYSMHNHAPKLFQRNSGMLFATGTIILVLSIVRIFHLLNKLIEPCVRSSGWTFALQFIRSAWCPTALIVALVFVTASYMPTYRIL
jgi:hypothetical protein